MLPRQSRATVHFPTTGDSQAPARSEATQGLRSDEAMPVSGRLSQIQNSRPRQQPLEAVGASSMRTSWFLARCRAPYLAAHAPRSQLTRRTTSAFAPTLLDTAKLPLATARVLRRHQLRPDVIVSSQFESLRVRNAGHVVQWLQYTLFVVRPTAGLRVRRTFSQRCS